VESEKQNKTDYLMLGVEQDNEPAIKIYERAGFIKDGPLHHKMHYMWKKL
jgi:ribosomal protein S18 acetylase RimI-like enzyme